MRAALPLLLLLLLAACERAPAPAADGGPPAARLLQQVRAGLASRDARLRSYRFEGRVHDAGEAPLPFAFAFRAPGSLRGSLGGPGELRTFAYDGEHLYEQHDGERRFTTFRLELPPAARAGFLTEVFSPFLPEGFRVPLPGNEGQVEYLLRWPALDFLGKRVLQGAGVPASGARGSEALVSEAPVSGAPVSGAPVSEVRVEDEQCDAALGLCVPRRLTRWVAGQRVGETTLEEVQLDAPLPADAFRLAAPAGYEARTQTLIAPP